jgi:N-acetylmuramidase/Bacterial SH3 domain
MKPAVAGQVITFYSYKGGTGRSMASTRLHLVRSAAHNDRLVVTAGRAVTVQQQIDGRETMTETAPRGTTTANVNLRQGPGTQFQIITTLDPRTALVIKGEEGDWLKVDASGQQGFVHRNFVLLATQQIISGFLIHRPEAGEWKLEPARRLAAPGGGQKPRLAATIWNKYGGLLETLSAKLGIDPGVALAVVATESGGSGFKDGRMIIRFENHHFWRLWGKDHRDAFNAYFRFNAAKSWTDHQFRSDAGEPWEKFHGDQDAEWKVFEKAQSLDERAAKSSISMGLPQIMGSNHAEIGYDSVEEMFTAFSTDERTQLLGLFDFIQGPHTVSTKVAALQRKDFTAFAEKYNGPGRAAQYGALLQSYFDAFRTL